MTCTATMNTPRIIPLCPSLPALFSKLPSSLRYDAHADETYPRFASLSHSNVCVCVCLCLHTDTHDTPVFSLYVHTLTYTCHHYDTRQIIFFVRTHPSFSKNGPTSSRRLSSSLLPFREAAGCDPPSRSVSGNTLSSAPRIV